MINKNNISKVCGENEGLLEIQKKKNQASLHYDCVKTEEKLKPIVLDALPAKLSIINFKNNYKVISCIGTGSFGTVKLCKKTSANDVNYLNTMMDNTDFAIHENYYNNCNSLVAVKTMMTRLDNLSSYARVRELKFIFNVPRHKNLLSVYECFIDDESYKLHIALEVMDQNLYQLIKFRITKGSGLFSHSSLQSILSQILNGLYHIHSNGFFHRDLKPENILISTTFKYYDKEHFQLLKSQQNYVVKIADYGLSRQINPNNNHFTAYVSTRWYRSPEILLRDTRYCKPIDIWAFGCVAFECATFTPLFPGSDEMDQIWKILEFLGTPYLTAANAKTGYVPHGGIWEESKKLIVKLNFQFPYIEGLDISKKTLPMVVDSPAYMKPNSSDVFIKLCEVLRKCLTWSPGERITVEQLTQLSYFQNTDVCLEHQNKVLKEKQLLLLEQHYFFNKTTSSASVFLPEFNSVEDNLLLFNSQNSNDTLGYNSQFSIPIPQVHSNKISSTVNNNSHINQFDLSFEESPKNNNQHSFNRDYENSFLDLYNTGLTKKSKELRVGADLKKQDCSRDESPLSAINFKDYNSSSNYTLQKASVNDSFTTDTSFNSNPKSFMQSIASKKGSSKLARHEKESRSLKIKSQAFNSKNCIKNENDP